MNSIKMIPDTNADRGRWDGDSQLKLGCSDPGGLLTNTLTSAVTDITISMTTSMVSSIRWNLAESSMPR